MCGRFTREFTWSELHDLLALHVEPVQEIEPSWNVAPTQATPVLVSEARGRVSMTAMTWGLRPDWLDAAKPGPINARIETAASNGMFRSAYRSRRCVVPISGFYEWGATGGGKQPFYIRPAAEPVFCLAGLWEESAAGLTFAVLTRDANEQLSAVHHRMPVMLMAERVAEWIESEEDAAGAIVEPEGLVVRMHPVSRRVNTPRNNDRSLVLPCEPERGLFDAGG